MKPGKSDRKGKRSAAVRAAASAEEPDPAAPPGAPLELQRQESDATVALIARLLRRRRPDLGEGAGDEAGAPYLAASFVAYAADRRPQSAKQWGEVLSSVLADAGMDLDEEDNDEAVRWVVKELQSKGALAAQAPQIEVGSIVLALLAEDDDWHEAMVEKPLDAGGGFRVIFLEYGKPQETPMSNIRTMSSVVDDEGTEDTLQEGDCEMCGRHMLLTFHHLIPKDVHPTYLKKKLPPGIEGEPTRGFLNMYGTMVCRQCHSSIHHIASNEVLAKEYNTLQKILDHPRVQSWVAFASKQRSGRWAP